MKITFTSSIVDPTLPEPVPASKKMPEWYKSIPRYIGGKKKPPMDSSSTTGTIKTCMPVLDVMTSGYLILSSADVFIRKTDEGRYYNWSDYDLITFHSQNQVTGYPKLEAKMKLESVPKFANHWIVQTPKNYSCLFVTPFHHDLPFTILPAIVDTDSYFNTVNFPFLPDPEFEGLIPKGTPIAQVIPFKRENWEMSIGHLKDSKDLQNNWLKVTRGMATEFFDRYKRNHWTAKSYK
jgi:hypothetical protein